MPIQFTPSGDVGYMAEQAAGSVLQYGLDWSEFLAQHAGDAIVSSVWEASRSELTTDRSTFDGAQTAVFVSGGSPGRWYGLANTVVTTSGRSTTRNCFLFVRETAVEAQSALFPDRIGALASMRRDYLPALAASYGNLNLSDQFLWSRLMAAEGHIAHTLRVPLRPTTFFPGQPSDGELADLNGEPWAIDPGYDLDPHDVQFGGIRFLQLRQVPVIEVMRVDMVYPGSGVAAFHLPLDWMRLDAKYGHLQIVPLGGQLGYGVPVVSASAVGGLASGVTVPQVFHITYRAGVQNILQAYPDLLDLAMRQAGIGILKARALPQSGSISADGLSQSTSAPDFGNMQDEIDSALADIRASIVGVRFTVL